MKTITRGLNIEQAKALIELVEAEYHVPSIADKTTWSVTKTSMNWKNKERTCNYYSRNVPYYDIRKALALYLKDNSHITVRNIARLILNSSDHTTITKSAKNAKNLLECQDEKFIPVFETVQKIGERLKEAV